jgi:hypothetical protein
VVINSQFTIADNTLDEGGVELGSGQSQVRTTHPAQKDVDAQAQGQRAHKRDHVARRGHCCDGYSLMARRAVCSSYEDAPAAGEFASDVSLTDGRN